METDFEIWQDWFTPAEAHDFDPTWDYEIRTDQKDHPDLAFAQLVMDEMSARDDMPFTKGWVYPSDLSDREIVGVYCSGTFAEPIVLIDLDAHEGNLEELRVTVAHEAAHAAQEATGEGVWADEDEAEAFGRVA